MDDRATRGGSGLRLALYVGGLLGPFGGGLVNAMLPELREAFGATSGEVGRSLTVYFVPFAALLLVSGTLGERWGRRRMVRGAYITYAAASLLCAVAPDLQTFLLGRAVQGAANAFTTPLLLAGLVDLAGPGRAGRSVGIYASFQATGQSLSPLVGGGAAEIDWRLGFVGIAAVAALLATRPPPGDPRHAVEAPPVRALLNARVGLLGLAAGASSLGALGITFLVALRCRDTFGLGPGATGFVLVGFGVAALSFGPVWGRVTDGVGARACGIAAALLGAALVAVLGHVHEVATFVALWTLAGVVGSLMSVSIQGLATGVTPTNRGGGVSATLAFRFAGFALAPALWLPVVESRGLDAAFTGAALTTLVVAVALAPLGWLVAGPDPGWGRRPGARPRPAGPGERPGHPV